MSRAYCELEWHLLCISMDRSCIELVPSSCPCRLRQLIGCLHSFGPLFMHALLGLIDLLTAHKNRACGSWCRGCRAPKRAQHRLHVSLCSVLYMLSLRCNACRAKTVVVTLWGSTAEEVGAQLEQQPDALISISSCRVTDFNGARPSLP